MIPALIVLLLAQAAASTSAKPVQVAEIDTGKLKGDPTRLAWAPDAASFYLQTTERKSNNETVQHHFLIPVTDGKPKKVDAAPEWADTYWAWKSAQAAPGQADFKIELIQEQRTLRATSVPMGGELARGGGTSVTAGAGEGLGVGEATAAAQQTQYANAIVLKVRGETVGEFVNTPLVPGLTFGWSPQAIGMLAYADRDGQVVLMDRTGKKNALTETKNTILPAWSDDGSRIAYLEKDGRRKYQLRVVAVSK